MSRIVRLKLRMPTPPTNTPHGQPDGPREPDTGRTFTQKLGIFMTGVAIGLMFLGWTQYRKGAAARQMRAQQAAERVETQTPPNAAGEAPNASEPPADVEETDAPTPTDSADPD